ncbi:MAG: hypothetical protein QXL67_05350 [Candidatus Bathyarchaeia archaeon]
MRVLLNYGIENVERRVKRLGTLLVDGLLEYGFKLQTPLEEGKRLFINVKVKDNRAVERILYENGVVVSARVGGLRVSPHFYNVEEEVEVFLNKLNEFSK